MEEGKEEPTHDNPAGREVEVKSRGHGLDTVITGRFAPYREIEPARSVGDFVFRDAMILKAMSLGGVGWPEDDR